MSPVHGAPFCIIGIILEEQMIFAFIGRKAVRVIDPADPSGHMEKRKFILCVRQIFLFKFPRSL